MKYLHFMVGQFYSREFIEEIQSNFKVNDHHFIIINYENKTLNLDPEKYQNVKSFTFSSKGLNGFFTKNDIKIRKLMKKAEYIFIHYLTKEMSRILFKFMGKAKLAWIIWGADLYEYIPLQLYDHYTSEILDHKEKSILKTIYYFFNQVIRKSVIKRLDYVISAHKGDIRLFKKFFRTKAKCFYESIYPNPIDFEKLDKKVDFVDEKYNFNKDGCKLLLLGNSGTPSNNHLDVMIRLSKMKEQNFKIICPLSYGTPNYIQKIIKNGKNLFGDRFITLLEFLNPNIYYHILNQIDIAIMYHNRQQGMGNIQILSYLGKPICMKKTSVYFNLLERGAFVFSTQDLEKLILDKVEFTKAMSINNKKIARQYFSVKSATSAIENVLNLLEVQNTK
ncbi:MAG: TDP-N-acetylfucosamine:lipid II N-acetylfucosaminyltransferase [Candidatus Thorarchaeota archaeon]